MPSTDTTPAWLIDPEVAQTTWRRQLARQDQALKHGIWAYFLLLIFEGALRKWFLPGLAAPLLIIRDPLALWIIIYAWTHHRLPLNAYSIGMALIGMLGMFTAILVGHNSWPVAIYGARIMLLHFPLIFIIGRVFTAEDVLKMGRVTVLISIFMTILIALQFFSPQSAWVNQGVGADRAGAGFSGALGYFRPPGTFSFTNGNTLFFSFNVCFILYFLLNPEKINRLILICATIALLAAIPLSISRGAFYHIAISVLFTAFAISRKPGYLGRMLLSAVGIGIGVLLLSQISFFQTSIMAFTSRFEAASAVEGGVEGTLLNRFLGSLIDSINNASEQPFWGYGLGMGTNVGAQLLSGDRSFLISEEEWARTIGELGALLGLFVIFMRIGLTTRIALLAYQHLQRGNLLPWLLLSFGAVSLPTESWAQPTSLGFCILISGLMIASLEVPQSKSETDFIIA
jgi:hypothetical protein